MDIFPTQNGMNSISFLSPSFDQGLRGYLSPNYFESHQILVEAFYLFILTTHDFAL